MAATCVLHLTNTPAEAAIPTFISGPAVINRASNDLPSGETVVFGYVPWFMGPVLAAYTVDRFQPSGPVWTGALADGFGIQEGYDGDPGATYLASGPLDIMTCGHAATGPGHIFCSRGSIDHDPEFGGIEFFTESPTQVGFGTFNPGASPALVDMQENGIRFTYIFARGTDNQIWLAYYDYASNAYFGWWQLPPSAPGTHFISDPAVTTYTADDLLIVCAQLSSHPVLTSHLRYACSKQIWGNGGQKVWSTWTPVSAFPQTIHKPALARTSARVYLLGINRHSSHVEYASSFPVGGGAWSAPARVGLGSGFLSGPAAVGTTGAGADLVLTVGRGSDSAYWFDTGSSSGWGSGWTQIQED